ncbi:MAG: FHA domain-containing protein [Acidimicrobiales bacterium]
MPEPLLTFLKYLFLVLLYLFFLRVLRAVWVELREPKTLAASPPAGAGLSSTPPAAGAHSPLAPVPASGIKPDLRLVVLEPAARKGHEFPLSEELTVGRAAGCGVSLPDDTFVSQLHARVFRHDGAFYVEDLGSTNGTYLNKKKVSTPSSVRKGDKLKIGRTVLEVRK